MPESIAVQENPEYEIKFLNESHLSQIMKLQELVVKNLFRPDIYYSEGQAFFQHALSGENNVIGLYKQGALIGFHVISLPGCSNENLGVDINLMPNEILQLAHMGPTSVHPDFHGHGLHSKMAEVHLHFLQKAGCEHICCTVSPYNYPSLKFLFSQGFVIAKLKTKFNNLLRCIMHLDVKRPLSTPAFTVQVANTDIETQKFITGLGFYGYDVKKNHDGYDIVYGHDGETK